MAARSYDPRSLQIIVAGKSVSGYAADTFVTVERANAMWNLTVGADGTAARAKSNDYSGSITLTLLQTSPSNSDLSALAAADELTNTGVFPVVIRDAIGGTVCAALTAWIEKQPSVEFGGNIAMRTWTIMTDRLTMSVAGN